MPIGIPTQDQLNKYIQTNTASTASSNSSTDYLSGNSLLGKTDTTTSSTKNNKINVETNNKDSNAKIIGRGLKELVPSIAKGVTSAVDSLADAPSAIAAGIANKAAENDATLRISANKAIERVKANQAEHALGENVKNWEQEVDARQQAIATDNPDSKLAQTVYKGTELAESIGQMVPSIAASAITGGIGGAVTKGAATAANIVSRTAEAAGLATMFGNVYSSSLKDNTDQGYDFTVSSDKAFRDALTEVGTELLFGGIAGTGKALITPKGLSKVADDAAVKSVRSKIGDKLSGSILAKGADALNTFSKTRIGNFLVGDIAEDGLGGILGEAAEEMISEIIGPYNERATTNPDAVNATLGEVIEAGLGGAIISAVFGGAQGVASKIKGVKATSNYNKWQSNPKETLRAFSALQNGADVESNAKKVFANFSDEINVNAFKDQFALPGDLKVELPTNIDSMTDAEAQAAVDAAIPQLAIAYKEYARRRALQAMSGEYKKAISSDSLASKSANVIEAQTKLDNAIKQATDLFGAEAIKNGLTTELNEQLKAQGIDINALEKDVIRRTNQAKKTIGLDISRAIKNGTAVDTYGQELIDQYLASKELNDVNTTLKVQSKSGNVDFGGYLRTTDADGNTVYRTANQISQERFGKNYNKLTNAQQAEIASEYIIQKQERLNRLTEAVSEMQKSIKASGTKNFNVAIATPEQIAQTGSSTSNAWWDSNTNTMYFNPEKATTKNSAYSFFAHEATHKIVDDLEIQDPTGAKKREFFDTITKAMYQSGYPVDAMIDKTSRIYGLNYYKQAYKALESGVYNSERLKEVYDETKASAGKGLTEKDIREIAAERFAKERLEGYDKNTDKGNVHVDGMLEEELMAKFMEKFFGSSDLMLELAKTNKTSLEQIGKAIKNSSAADIKYNKVLARTRYEILANINDALAGTLQTESQKVKTAYPDAKKEKRQSLSDTLSDGTELSEDQREFFSDVDRVLLDEDGHLIPWFKGRAATDGGYQSPILDNLPQSSWGPYTTMFFAKDEQVARSYAKDSYGSPKHARKQFVNPRVDTLEDVDAYINSVNETFPTPETGVQFVPVIKAGKKYYHSVAEALASGNTDLTYGLGLSMFGEVSDYDTIQEFETKDAKEYIRLIREVLPERVGPYLGETQSLTKNLINAKNVYVIDGEGKLWNQLPAVPDSATPVGTDGTTMTNEWVRWAYEHGYDAIMFKNIRDVDSGDSIATDVLAVINPQGKVKFADNKHPSYNSDARYSLSDEAISYDELTPHMRSFYKNVDKHLRTKDGKLKVWYKGDARYQTPVLDDILYTKTTQKGTTFQVSFLSDSDQVAASYMSGDFDKVIVPKFQSNPRIETVQQVVDFVKNINKNYSRKPVSIKPNGENFDIYLGDSKLGSAKGPLELINYVNKVLPNELRRSIETKPGTVTRNLVDARNTYVVKNRNKGAQYWTRLKAPAGANYSDYDHFSMSDVLYSDRVFTDEELSTRWTTDMIVAWAADNGYDSVLFENINDPGDGMDRVGNVLAVINPKGKLKDIDNLHPTRNADTRYSLSDDILEEDPLDWEEGMLDEFMGLDIEDEMLRKTPDTDALGNPLSVGQQYFYADSIGTRDNAGKLIPLVPSPFAEGSPYAEAGGYYYRPATASDETGLIYYGKMTRPVQIKEQFIMDLLESTPDVVTQYGYDGVKVGDNLFMFVDEAQITEATDLNPLQTYEARMSLSDDVNSDDFAPFDMTGLVNDTGVTGVSDERMRQYEELRTKYGLNNGTSIPGQINSHVGTSRLYGRLIDSNQTPNQLRGAMVNQLLEGIGTHLIMTDDAAMDYVQNQMAKYSTLNEAVDKTKELYTAGHMVNKNELAFGQQLLLDLGNEINRINYYNETVTDESLKKNTDGLVDMAESLLADLAASATRAGQNLQAFALLKKMTPQGRLYYLDAQIEQYVSEMVDRKGNSRVGGFQFKTDARGNILRDANGNAIEIKIPDELRQEMLACTSQEELNAVEEKIVTAIAKQIPATLTDRVVAWRYLSMLGNPRTHIRNIVSNIAMGGLVKVKNTVKGALEDLFLKEQTSGRTSTNKRIDPTLKKAYQELAIEDWDKNGVSDEALSGGKVGFQSLINQKRNKFGKSGFAEAVNKLNNLNTNGVKEGTLLGGLEGEDYWSGKNAYVQAFTKYCAANNLDVDYLKSGTVNSNTALAQARSYAVNEAAKATYHDANNLAQHLAQIERQNGTLGKIIVGGLIPFKKTPGNILKRGIEYSPIGLINGAIDLVQASRTTVEDYKGEYSALNSQDALNLGKATQRFDAQAKRTRAICDAIDRLSAGLTGTGILLLGYFLGSLGILKGAGSDNDREKYYDQMQGTQEYSITIAGKNFTLDWLTPSSMPLFAGVAIADLFAGDTNFSTGDILTGLSKIADPVMNLSVLQGVNDALGSYDSGLGKVALSAAEGYIGQMIPTLAGQIARTIDPTRRTTYAPTNDENASSKEINTFINRMKNKLPFASQTNQEYIDMWGRTESRGDSIIGRFFSQAVAPWYQKDINQTEADDLIAQVYQATGDRSVIPTSPESSYTIGNTTYRLSEKEYHDVKEMVGQLSYVGVYTLKQVPGFSSLSSEAQADIIANIYSFARKIGKSDYAYANGITYEEDSSTTRIKQAVAAGMTIGEAVYANYMANNLTADKDSKGKTISGSKKAKVYSLYQALGLTDAQIKAISQYEYD